jgi:tetratricopeptide (TPR) repeat protein
MQAAPDSLTGFDFARQAYLGLQKFDDWDRMIQARLQKHPDDPDYIRSAALLAGYRGQFAKTRELYKGLMDRGKATEEDLNGYAWNALLIPGPIDQDSMEAAQRANELTKNANYGILHTLACLDAETGKTTQARDLLLKAMEAAKEDEPDSEIWFGFGKIAEQYGEYDAARAMYNRMEKPKTIYPAASYALAQQRLAALPPAAASKSAGH